MTVCSHCAAHALGTEVVSVCVDCGTATVAGAGVSVSTLVLAGVSAACLVLGVRGLRAWHTVAATLKMGRGRVAGG